MYLKSGRTWWDLFIIAGLAATLGCGAGDSIDTDAVEQQDDGLSPQGCAQLVAPDAIDLGMVKEPVTRDIVLQNAGTCPLVVPAVVFEGPPYFTLDLGGIEFAADDPAEKVVLGEPLVVLPGISATWQVTYAPEAGWPASATLKVFPETGPYAETGKEIEITANTKTPCINVVPSSVDFHGKLIGQTASIDVEIRSCGTAPLEVTDIFLQDGTEGTYPSSTVFQLDHSKLPTGVKPTIENPLVVDVDDSVVFTVQCTPDHQAPMDPVTGEYLKDTGVIQIDNNSFASEVKVDALCFGTLTKCPQPVIVIEEGEEVPLHTTIHLYGDQSHSPNGAVTSYQWTVDQPFENNHPLVPSPITPNPMHLVDVSSAYTYCLDVCDEKVCSNDLECESTACKKLWATCPNDIHCELTWDTPDDPNQYDEGPGTGSDMDLHFAHQFATGPDIDEDGKPDPWFDLTWDCFWYNPNPEWESLDPNVSDNPSLDRNDEDGAGPENMNLERPVDGRTYRIGVHYWDDHGFGASYPTVKCWIAGQQVYEKNLKDLGVPMKTCDMWDVATIEWPSGWVTSVMDASGGPKITHCYKNPAIVQIGGDTCDCE